MADGVIEPASGASIGRYQLVRKLAAGGMAEIYLARVTGVGGFTKQVVIKRILPQLAESEQFFRMFLDEARIAATLQHPNVVQVYDAGEVEGQYYIAMEYLDGADLATIRRHLEDAEDRLSYEDCAFIASCVCAGLHYAHERTGPDGGPLGIVHRDVSPQNVFVTREGGVKLVDFGIAKAANRLSRTTYGTMKGKLAFMSPEQCQGEEVDRRSDIYALGVVLYQATTGENPHQGNGEYALLKEIVEGTIEPPKALLPDYPPALEAIVMKALAKRPEDRYQSARELQMSLETYLRGAEHPVSALMLSDRIRPILEEIRAEAESRSDRWANEAEAYEEYLAAKRARPAAARRSPAKASPAARSPAPEPAAPPSRPALGPELAPELDVGRIDVRSGRKLAFAIAAIAAAAAGFAAYQLSRDSAEVAAPDAAAPAAERPAVPERGVIAADSNPGGAAVWRLVGRTPIESLPLGEDPAQLRIVHDGYAAQSAALAGEPLSITLSPAGARRRPSRRGGSEWLPGEDAAPYRPGERSVAVTSDPPAAEVWVYQGSTPLEIADVGTSEPTELRFERRGYRPAFVEVTERSYSASGEARVHPTLGRAR